MNNAFRSIYAQVFESTYIFISPRQIPRGTEQGGT